MVRLLLLLLIAAGLAIFTVQNLSPIAIVVLGIKTPTLPLAVWVLGAIVAGGLTTILLSGFSSLSKSAAVRRSTRRAEPEPARSSWSGGSQRQSEPSRRNAAGFSATRQTDDDWDTPTSDDWDDWGEGSARRPASSSASSSTGSSSNTRVRDTADDDWKDWSGYEESRRPASGSTSSSTYQRVPRTDFEARQTPASTQRSGSSYSYSYREPQDTPPERSSERRVDRPSDKTSEVYDAEYRVLVPPYNPDNAPPVSPPPPPPEPPISTSSPSSTTSKAEDDEDWGDLFDDLDSNKR